MDSTWLTPAEAAHVAGESVRTIQRWCDEGRPGWRAIRIGRQWRVDRTCLGLQAALLPARRTWRAGELATWLRVSRWTIQRLIVRGDLRTIDVRGHARIPRTEILTLTSDRP